MDATTFPISFTWHLVFAILACVFFIVQYVRTQKAYRLLLAIGIPASLCIYIQPDNHSLFVAVGAFEGVLLLGAIVFAIIEKRDRKLDKKRAEQVSEDKVKSSEAKNVKKTEESETEAEPEVKDETEEQA